MTNNCEIKPPAHRGFVQAITPHTPVLRRRDFERFDGD
jgi:hypothetical protein